MDAENLTLYEKTGNRLNFKMNLNVYVN